MALLFMAMYQHTDAVLLIKFTLSGAPSHLHHSLRSKLHLVHPLPLKHPSIGSHRAEAALRIDAQPIGRDDAEAMVHRHIKSNEMRTYTTLSIVVGIPRINVQIQQGSSDVFVHPGQILK